MEDSFSTLIEDNLDDTSEPVPLCLCCDVCELVFV